LTLFGVDFTSIAATLALAPVSVALESLPARDVSAAVGLSPVLGFDTRRTTPGGGGEGLQRSTLDRFDVSDPAAPIELARLEIPATCRISWRAGGLSTLEALFR